MKEHLRLCRLVLLKRLRWVHFHNVNRPYSFEFLMKINVINISLRLSDQSKSKQSRLEIIRAIKNRNFSTKDETTRNQVYCNLQDEVGFTTVGVRSEQQNRAEISEKGPVYDTIGTVLVFLSRSIGNIPSNRLLSQINAFSPLLTGLIQRGDNMWYWRDFPRRLQWR